MTPLSRMRAKLVPAVALVASGLFAVSSVTAQTECGICDQEVVINSDLASCFLEKYQELANRTEAAIVVDLSACSTDRSVVAAIPGPDDSAVEPKTEFLLSRAQLDCLKAKLEEPGLALDPSARIDLGSCG